MNNAELELDRLDKVCQDLGEHYDTVQVFVTRHTPGDDEESGTINAHTGRGNWLARLGQVKDWVIKQDEKTRISCREEV